MCELLLVKYMRHEDSMFRSHYLDKTGSQQTLDSEYQSWEAFLVLYTQQNWDPEKVIPSGISKCTSFDFQHHWSSHPSKPWQPTFIGRPPYFLVCALGIQGWTGSSPCLKGPYSLSREARKRYPVVTTPGTSDNSQIRAERGSARIHGGLVQANMCWLDFEVYNLIRTGELGSRVSQTETT